MSIENGPFQRGDGPRRNEYTAEDRARYAKQLQEEIIATLVKPDEYYPAGDQAFTASQERGFRDGVRFRGAFIGYEQKHLAPTALECLSREIRRSVSAHGIGSNIPLDMLRDPKQAGRFPLFALLQVLATGVLKGDSAFLESPDGFPARVFTDAPFILLSNKGEPLTEVDAKTGESRLKHLRGVLVNGQYAPMVGRLRRMFPGVSFWTAEDVNDKKFDKKGLPFVSFDDMIAKKVSEVMGP